ncbi:MAG TPA: hypothetical protein VLT33_33625 [Labilithrix sp.]|nr:hypothetical protein [Labilithrix sp.]
MRVQSLVSLPLLALLALVACGSNTKSAPPVAAISLPVGSTPAGPGGGPVAASDEAELRARALAALDEGDLESADGPLREVIRRHPERVGTLGLLAALESTTGRSKLENHAFANLRPTLVTAPPAPMPTKPTDSVKLTAKVLPKGPSFDRDRDVFFQSFGPPFPVRPRRGVPTIKPQPWLPFFLPRTFGGNSLLSVKWTGARWLGLYGRGRSDARFVLVTDPDGKPLDALDFRAWRTKSSALESGISEVDLANDVLYVRQELNASEGFFAAVDVKSGKTIWRSTGIGMSTHFVVGDEHLFVWVYGGGQPGAPIPQGFQVIERGTGAIATRIPTPYVSFGLLPTDGALLVESGGPGLGNSNLVSIAAKVHRTERPGKQPDPPGPTRRIGSSRPTDARDIDARAAAYAMLDAGKTLEALLALRSLFDRHPESFAIEALHVAAEQEANRLREVAAAEAQRRTPKLVETRIVALKTPRRSVVPAPAISFGPEKNALAPVPRTGAPPRLRFVEEKETRRHPSGWFSDKNLTPTTFEIDESPGPQPILARPLWLPATRDGSGLMADTVTGEQVVAVYGNDVSVFRKGQEVATLAFDPGQRELRIPFADAIGNVLLASVRPWGDEASLVAVDLATGKPYWQTTNLALSSFVAQDGYLIGSTEGLGKKPELVVIEADTGRVISRTPTPNAVPSFANLLARDGATLWGFNVINTTRLAIE